MAHVLYLRKCCILDSDGLAQCKWIGFATSYVYAICGGYVKRKIENEWDRVRGKWRKSGGKRTCLDMLRVLVVSLSFHEKITLQDNWNPKDRKKSIEERKSEKDEWRETDSPSCLELLFSYSDSVLENFYFVPVGLSLVYSYLSFPQCCHFVFVFYQFFSCPCVRLWILVKANLKTIWFNRSSYWESVTNLVVEKLCVNRSSFSEVTIRGWGWKIMLSVYFIDFSLGAYTKRKVHQIL